MRGHTTMVEPPLRSISSSVSPKLVVIGRPGAYTPSEPPYCVNETYAASVRGRRVRGVNVVTSRKVGTCGIRISEMRVGLVGVPRYPAQLSGGGTADTSAPAASGGRVNWTMPGGFDGAYSMPRAVEIGEFALCRKSPFVSRILLGGRRVAPPAGGW